MHKGTFSPHEFTIGTKVTKFGTTGSFCSKLEHKVPFYVSQKEQIDGSSFILLGTKVPLSTVPTFDLFSLDERRTNVPNVAAHLTQ